VFQVYMSKEAGSIRGKANAGDERHETSGAQARDRLADLRPWAQGWEALKRLPAVSSAATAPAPAAAASTAIAAATTATPSTAFSFRTRFVHIQGASTELRAVQGGDSFFSVFRVGHLDKPETA